MFHISFCPWSIREICTVSFVILTIGRANAQSSTTVDSGTDQSVRSVQSEVLNMPYAPWTPNVAGGGMPHCGPWTFGAFDSIQVNVDATGCNVVGDAANEPSIAFDPTDPNKIVIAWRQFDTIASDFRQAGIAYSHDGGATWTFPGVLAPGTFHSDPVLAADRLGNFYYASVNGFLESDLFRSFDGGVSWDGPIAALGGDKHWLAVDRTEGLGAGNLYLVWSPANGCCGDDIFCLSSDAGATYSDPVAIPQSPFYGTLSVGVNGEVYVIGNSLESSDLVLARSSNAFHSTQTPVFEHFVTVFSSSFGALCGVSPNPGGLFTQPWVLADHSTGPHSGNLYAQVAYAIPPYDNRTDILFSRSTDNGVTWSDSIRLNDDPISECSRHWFNMLSVAPNGRIDAAWYDTRNTPATNFSQVYYTYSNDGGTTWAPNLPVTEPFDTHIGYPSGQNKIGDYCHMVSTNETALIAFAATFNGEQDVYFLRVTPGDCNSNGVIDLEDVADGTSIDCDADQVPDECAYDCNLNGVPDTCDVTQGGSADCDTDFLPDECETDFDSDGTIDDCDADIDNDGVANQPDACDRSTLGIPVAPNGTPIFDIDADCRIDLGDYSPLDNCILASGPNDSAPTLCRARYNIDQDIDVDLADFAVFQRGFTGP